MSHILVAAQASIPKPFRKRGALAPARPCETCGAPFQPREAHLLNGHGRFCSRSCSSRRQKTPKWYATHERKRAELVSAPFFLNGALVCAVKLNNGGTSLVDANYADVVRQYTWHRCSYGYAKAGQRGAGKCSLLFLHRLVCPCPSDLEIDHFNHNRLDNRRANLRVVTSAGNRANLQPAWKASVSRV